MANESIFTFDTSPFLRGLKKVTEGIGGLQKSAGNMAKNVSSGVVNAVKKIGLLTLAFKGVQSAIREMPEIGKTFQIAKGIIMKNLLFPLRKAVFPLLQKFLNWVRDNRAMFVKWGQTLVNVFTTVVSAVGKVIDIGNRLMKTFAGFIGRVFGTEIRSFQELLNILSFKFAVVIEFISSLLGKVGDTMGPIIKVIADNIGKILDPVMKIAGHIIDIVSGLFDMKNDGSSLVDIFRNIMNFVGDAATFVAEMVESFIKGLKPHIKPIAETIGKIAGYFKSMFDSVFGSNESIKGWKEIFEFIGNVVGTTILSTFETIEGIIKTIDDTIKSIKDVENLLSGKEVSKDFGKTLGEAIQGIYGIFDPTFKAHQMLEKERVKDVIITPEGKIIKTDPSDYLIATKTPGNLVTNETRGNMNINIDFTGMQIVVQEGTREEAARFSESIVTQLRNAISLEYERTGLK